MRSQEEYNKIIDEVMADITFTYNKKDMNIIFYRDKLVPKIRHAIKEAMSKLDEQQIIRKE
jgi:hypothetical protein